jgi:hypothetical protein
MQVCLEEYITGDTARTLPLPPLLERLACPVCAALLSAWGCLLRVSAAQQCTGLGSARLGSQRHAVRLPRSESTGDASTAGCAPMSTARCARRRSARHRTAPLRYVWCVHSPMHRTSTAHSNRVHAPDPRRRCARHSASRMAMGSDLRLARRIDAEWKSEACSGACGARS